MAKKQIKKESHKLVIAISSRALFNLDHSHQIFKEEGIEAYAKHQQENESSVLEPGVGSVSYTHLTLPTKRIV